MTYKEHRKVYLVQRRNAKRRDIPWEFNYIQWWRKWCESGKWNQRGIGSYQYVMSRFGDNGPYSYENTRICTSRKNHKETTYTHTLEGRRKISLSKIGNKAWLGKKHSPETRKKISANHGKYWLGKEHSLKSRRKMSLSQKERWSRRKQNAQKTQ